MEDVTDAAFRHLIASYADPALPRVLFTEFTAADGLVLADERGKRKLFKKLQYSEVERPIVAQLFSAAPERMEAAARLCEELGFDGVDINMGCPVKEVVNTGCGAAMIQNPALASEIIRAVKRGAPSIPVSVKTRIGYNENEIETWVPHLLGEGIAALTIHARTRKEMSEVPARWEHVARTVEIRDAMKASTLIIGNGDLKDLADARAKMAATGSDGAMLGRAVYGNPWIFNDADAQTKTPEEKMRTLIEHIELFQKHLSGFQNDAVMKRHFKAYIGGWDNAKELRQQLMDAPLLEDAKALLLAALNNSQMTVR
jgi:nifR3 family TIM-barrel protein